MTAFIKKHKDTMIRIMIQIISFVLFSQAFANTLLSVKKIVAAIAGLALGQQASLASGQQAGNLVAPLLVLAATVPATDIAVSADISAANTRSTMCIW